MIPEPEILDQFFPRQEANLLADIRHSLLQEKSPQLREKFGRQLLRELWDDEITYIEKTHWIRTKEPGVVRQLQLNYAQRRFYKDVIVRCREEKRPIRAIVLKARQLGFSTFIQSWQYEQCDREPNRVALTISYDADSSGELFRKAKFVHDRMWFPRKLARDSTEAIEFQETSSVFHVRTSGNLSAGRGDTFHHLHCSEIPMWANPGETLASALQAVPLKPSTSIFYESTAKGAVGEFYDAWGAAEGGRSEFVPFFAPWFWDPEYVLEFRSADERNQYGREMDLTERRLQEAHHLTLEQLNWRRWKIRNDLQGSEPKFRQEFPSTATEAFLTTGSPVFDADAIALLEHNAKPPMWRGNILLEL